MEKIYRQLLLVSVCLLAFIQVNAQDTVRIDFTGMNPHIGQSLFFRVVDISDNSEVGRTSVVVTSPDFSLKIGGIVPGGSYNLDFFADLNKNGRYDAPPADHAWRITLDTVKGDTTVPFAHNVSFTDIAWIHRLTLAFSNMTPHIGEDLYFALKYKNSGWEVERKKLREVSANFDLAFDGIMPDSSYLVDFFADHNKNGKYDPPGIDHAWRITLDSVKGDTVVPFVHNINFTDIAWIHRITIAFSGMNPHVGENLYFALKYKTSGWEIERRKLTEVDPAFNVAFDHIMPDSSYMIDFFADHNKNGRYDPPGTDHAWRITLDSVKGDTIVPFVHNVNFTDIEWKYKLMVDFTGMTPHLDQVMKLYLRNNVTQAFIDSIIVNTIHQADFNISLFSIMPDSSYNIDFYVDFNENGMYDVPPVDHAWRIPLLDVRGDTIVNFAHNTDFTDIGLAVISGINDLNGSGFNTYPNPAGDELIIKSKQNDLNITGIRIFNSSGRLVIDQSPVTSGPEVRINVSSLKPGLYILNVSEGLTIRKVKFVKK
jgi:hypothetical protein